MWTGLILTVIGWIPEFGSLIKGIVKLIRKGGKTVKLDKVFKVFNYFAKGNAVKWIKELVTKLPKHQKTVTTKLNNLFSAMVDSLQSVKSKLPSAMSDLIKKFDDTIVTINKARDQIDTMVGRFFKELKQDLDDVIARFGKVNSETVATKKTFSKKQEASSLPVKKYDLDKLYASKNLGQIEPGARKAKPGEINVIKNHTVDAPTLPKGWSKKYDMSGDRLVDNDLLTFAKTPTADVLPEGTKMYRFVDADASPSGSYWVLEKDLPKTEGAWRSGSAVKNSWNGDGAYVEYEVPKGGLNVWRCPAAKQESNIAGNVLEGGGEQIWVPRGTVTPNDPVPSAWNKNY